MNKKSAKEKLSISLKLFTTMLYISTFTFGGGFVIVTFMKKKFVDEYKWIDDKEMMDITALAESSPGAIAVNAAVLVGWKTGGFAGMLAAVAGTIIPPMLIIAVISFFYAEFATNKYVAFLLKGMQAGVAAVILDVVCSLGIKVFSDKRIYDVLIFAGAFICVFLLDINVILIIAAAAVCGIILEAVRHKKAVKK